MISHCVVAFSETTLVTWWTVRRSLSVLLITKLLWMAFVM